MIKLANTVAFLCKFGELAAAGWMRGKASLVPFPRRRHVEASMCHGSSRVVTPGKLKTPMVTFGGSRRCPQNIYNSIMDTSLNWFLNGAAKPKVISSEHRTQVQLQSRLPELSPASDYSYRKSCNHFLFCRKNCESFPFCLLQPLAYHAIMLL